jgi:hypothetical protein
MRSIRSCRLLYVAPRPVHALAATLQVNKAVLSTFNFEGYFTLYATQLLVAVAFCRISRDYFGNPFEVPRLTVPMLVAGIPMAALQVASVGAGLVSMRLVNIPMFFCIRRTTTAWILLLEYLWLGRVADPRIQASVAIIVVAALIAGWDSLGSDIFGYFLVTLNNIFTAGSSVAQKKFSEQVKVSAFGQLYISASLALPSVAAIVLLSGEVPYVLSFKHLDSPMFWVGFVASALLGLAVSYAAMLCSTYNSPLAMSITGNVKDLATTSVGWALFGDFVATTKSLGGLALSFVGAGLYSYVSLQKALAGKAAPPPAIEPAAAASAPQVDEEVDGKRDADLSATTATRAEERAGDAAGASAAQNGGDFTDSGLRGVRGRHGAGTVSGHTSGGTTAAGSTADDEESAQDTDRLLQSGAARR